MNTSSGSRVSLFVALCLMLSHFNVPTLCAQIHASRGIDFRDVQTNSSEFGFLSSMKFGLEMQRALGSVTPPIDETEEEELSEFPSRDQAWNIKFVEDVELYRWSELGHLRFVAGQELCANERNDIHFNPRSIIWEEELSVRGLFDFRAGGQWSTSVAAFHRCKHDVDNSDQEQNDEIVPGRVQKRSIILSGFAVREKLQPMMLRADSGLQLQAEIGAEYYLMHRDYRYPVLTFGTSWSRARAALCVGLELKHTISQHHALALRTYISQMLFSRDLALAAAQGYLSRAELRIDMRGKAGELSIMLCNERSFDEVVRISADPTNTWSIGIAFRP